MRCACAEAASGDSSILGWAFRDAMLTAAVATINRMPRTPNKAEKILDPFICTPRILHILFIIQGSGKLVN